MEEIHEGRAEVLGTVLGGVEVGGLELNNGGLAFVADAASGRGLLGEIRSDDSRDAVLFDELEGRVHRELSLGLVVLVLVEELEFGTFYRQLLGRPWR